MPTNDEIARLRASAFDVRLRYFAASEYMALLSGLDGFTQDPPQGWTVSGDVITPPAPWTECTADIVHDGVYEERLNDDNSITWSVRLRGYNYTTTKYGTGRALCCFRRIVTPDTDTGWRFWWVGHIADGDLRQDYREGGEWQRTVRSLDHLLRRYDSPRIVLGRPNLATGATVTVSSTLSDPNEEINAGEYVGTLASVAPENIIDSRRNTTWISRYPPITTAETPDYTGSTYIKVDEVFLKPIPGYDPAASWWIELLVVWHLPFDIVQKGARGICVFTINSAGQRVCLSFDAPGGQRNRELTRYNVSQGDRIVICGDQRIFEEINGGACPAKYVIEAKSWGTVADNRSGWCTTDPRAFNLDPVNGYVVVGTAWDEIDYGTWWDGVKWGNPSVFPYASWSGSSVNISGMQAYQSIRRSPSGKDTNSASDWIIESYPRPGDKWAPSSSEWIYLETPAHTSTLAEDVAAGATTIKFAETTLGWPSSGAGIIEGDTFTYTGKTTNTLTGCSGLLAHSAGAVAYPLANGITQTGWLNVTAKFYRRPGLSTIKRARLYHSPYASLRKPGETGWESDYAPVIGINNPNSNEFSVTLPSTAWVRTLLLVIDEMSDGGRAKLNELYLYPNDATADGVPIGSSSTWAAVTYLLSKYIMPYLASSFAVEDGTDPGWGVLGNVALAVAPIPEVVADIARTHGCLLRWRPNYSLRVEYDPWWYPGAQSTVDYTFTQEDIRNEIAITARQTGVTGVALQATLTNGEPIARIVMPQGASGSGVRELSGYTVPDTSAAYNLAYSMFCKLASARRATWTAKGVGEWIRCGRRYDLLFGTTYYGIYLVDGVTMRWAPGRWETEITGQEYVR